MMEGLSGISPRGSEVGFNKEPPGVYTATMETRTLVFEPENA